MQMQMFLLLLFSLLYSSSLGFVPTASPSLPTVIGAPVTWPPGAYTFTGPLIVLSTLTLSGQTSISAPSVTVAAGGVISGVGGGFAAKTGPCWLGGPFAYSGEGGSHAGCQARNFFGQGCPSNRTALYGDAFWPMAMGCGGAPGTYSASCAVAGAGGAALLLNVSGTLTVNGSISVDGAAGGAGGSACYEVSHCISRARDAAFSLERSPHSSRLHSSFAPPRRLAEALADRFSSSQTGWDSA